MRGGRVSNEDVKIRNAEFICLEVLDIVENQKYLGSLLASVGGWKLLTAKSDPGHEKRVVSVQSCLDPIDWAM
jgi:hypothetical protein